MRRWEADAGGVRSFSREVEIALSGRLQKRRAWLSLSIDNGAPVDAGIQDAHVGARAHARAHADAIRQGLARARATSARFDPGSALSVAIEPFEPDGPVPRAFDVVEPSLQRPGEMASPEQVAGIPAGEPPAPAPVVAPPVTVAPANASPDAAGDQESVAAKREPSNPEAVIRPAAPSEDDEAAALLRSLMAEEEGADVGLSSAQRAWGLEGLADQARRLRNRSAEDPSESVSGDEDEGGDPASSQNAPASALSHGFFDRLGQSMRYSNTFDVGSFELNERLRDFEREVDAQEAAQAFSSPTRLDDVELVSELSAIQQAQQADGSAPATEAPPEAQKERPYVEPVAAEVEPAAGESRSSKGAAEIGISEPEARNAEPRRAVRDALGPVLASGSLPEGAAAAASIAARLHDLVRDPAAVVAGTQGWSVYGGPPPSSFSEAVEHFGLETASGDLVRDREALRELATLHRVLAVGVALEGGPVRLVTLAAADAPSDGPEAPRFGVTALAGESAGETREMTYEQLMEIFNREGEPRPLVVAYA